MEERTVIRMETRIGKGSTLLSRTPESSLLSINGLVGKTLNNGTGVVTPSHLLPPSWILCPRHKDGEKENSGKERVPFTTIQWK